MRSSAEHWLEVWRCAAALSEANLRGVAGFWDLQERRGRWLAELSQILDRHMRSKAFLDWMAFNLRAMAEPNPGGPSPRK
jgi:hypothetical protein